MPYAHPHQSRRVQVSSVGRLPAPKKRGPGSTLALGFGVGLSMLVIVGLYAASFRYNATFQEAAENGPRWGVLDEHLTADLDPIKRQLFQFGSLKKDLAGVIEAKTAQAAALDLLKKKLETATGTPETATKP